MDGLRSDVGIIIGKRTSLIGASIRELRDLALADAGFT
jgi:hypothetical protein